MADVHFVLAETSKTPFYIVGGAFVLWAVALSAVGMSRDRFPGPGGGRGVMAFSLVLMLGAMATAVATASKPEHEGKSQIKPIPASGPGSVPGLSTAGSSASSSAPATTTTTSGGSAPAAGSNTIAVQADPAQLKFTTTSLSAKAGKDTIAFDNPSQIPHNVQIKDSAGKDVGGTKTIPHGKTTASVTLKAGTYTYYCSVPGHEQAGMKGTLTVK